MLVHTLRASTVQGSRRSRGGPTVIASTCAAPAATRLRKRKCWPISNAATTSPTNGSMHSLRVVDALASPKVPRAGGGCPTGGGVATTITPPAESLNKIPVVSGSTEKAPSANSVRNRAVLLPNYRSTPPRTAMPISARAWRVRAICPSSSRWVAIDWVMIFTACCYEALTRFGMPLGSPALLRCVTNFCRFSLVVLGCDRPRNPLKLYLPDTAESVV